MRGGDTLGHGSGEKHDEKACPSCFFDEFGCSFQEKLRHTWAPRGRRPIIRRTTAERCSLTMAVGLAITGKIYKRYFCESMRRAHVVTTLQHLFRYMPKGFVLIWDRARIHTSAETQRFLAQHPEICVEWLPPYAPELNAEEYCHGQVKRRLSNATPVNRK